jgi:hypothetical protein
MLTVIKNNTNLITVISVIENNAALITGTKANKGLISVIKNNSI